MARLGQKVTDGNAVEITDERLLNGTWQQYHRETFYPQDPSVEEAWMDAYDQSERLYVGDGYWDL